MIMFPRKRHACIPKTRANSTQRLIDSPSSFIQADDLFASQNMFQENCTVRARQYKFNTPRRIFCLSDLLKVVHVQCGSLARKRTFSVPLRCMESNESNIKHEVQAKRTSGQVVLRGAVLRCGVETKGSQLPRNPLILGE